MDSIQFTDLMELADIVAERLGNPITIEDQHHQVVAYSIHGETPDPVRIETIMKRKVPETVLARFWKVGVIQSLMHSDQPVRIPSMQDLGLGNRTAISIRKGNEVLGYIWVQETGRPLTEEDYGILRRAARLAMPRLLQKRDRYVKKEESKKALFWQLLSGNSSFAEVQQQAANLSISFPPYMVVVTGEIECEENQWLSIQRELDYLLETLKETTPFSILPLWVYDERQCIVLGGSKKREGLEIEAGQFLLWLNSRFTTGKGIKIKNGGYGSVVNSLQNIPRSYRQSLEVIELKKSLPGELDHIYGYTELGFFRYFPLMKELNEKDGYGNVHLQRLARYDQENHGNLLETLTVFLDHGGRINQAAEVLHIHTNTLHYRMKKIEEVGKIGLGNPLQRTTLYLELKLNKYKK